MYTERAKFEFFENVPQSGRLEFLSKMARELEAASTKRPANLAPSTNSGFSIEAKANGIVTVDIWHPWKAEALWDEVRRGHAAGLYRVTSPKGFSG